MSQVDVTYDGNQACTAQDMKTGKRIAVDCPMTKGDEFGPDDLVAAGLGSCILISMASFAERHGLDVAGSRAHVGMSLAGKAQPRISAIDVTVHVPRNFAGDERAALERAAATCPIKHSFRPDTEITTRFEFASV